MRLRTSPLAALAALVVGGLSAQSRTPFRVTDLNETAVFQPRLSPDGQWVAYVWDGPGYGERTLRVRRVDGTGLRDVHTFDSSTVNRNFQFTWQQRTVSSTSELLWVYRNFIGCYVNRQDPRFAGGLAIMVKQVRDIYLPARPCGDVIVAVAQDFNYNYMLFRNGPSNTIVDLFANTNPMFPVDVSPDGTRALYLENPTGSIYTNQLWSQQIAVAPYWRQAFTVGNPPYLADAGFVNDNDNTYLLNSMTQGPWSVVHGDLSGLEAWTNNAFVNAASIGAHPGHLANPPTAKKWLTMNAAEVPPWPIALPAPYLVTLMPPAQGGLVWLHQAQPGVKTVDSVTMDRDATKVVFREASVSGTNAAIYVLDLDREVSATCSHSGTNGTVTVSVPCAAGEGVLLGGAYGLVALPATLPGFRGEIWLDSTWSLLMLAVGTGTGPAVYSTTFPNSSALIGTTIYYQAMRTDSTMSSGDISRVVQVRWF